MALHPRNILSLCAGVGGLELGISLALHARGEAARGICYVEREASAAASLVASMGAGWLHPAPVWSDLTTFDARPWRGLVHILASGDPCQDNSVAGQRAGADGERFLAPEVVRVARECRPRLIVRENVPGNADGQLAAIVPALERLGYIVAAGIFSSAETGNTMRRERLFIMAEREGGGFGECGQEGGAWGLGHADGSGEGLDGAEDGARSVYAGSGRPRERAADAGGAGTSVGGPEGPSGRPEQQSGSQGSGRGGSTGAGDPLAWSSGQYQQGEWQGRAQPRWGQLPSGGLGGILPPAVIPGPTDSRWRDVLDRWPELQPALSQEEAESHLRRGIDAMAHRVERLRATGNGVDPVVAAYAFLRLNARLAEAGPSGLVPVRAAA